jgi:ribosomal protein L37AE/L43A
LISINAPAAGLRDQCSMFEADVHRHDPYDPTRCQVCGRTTRRVRTIARTFQDDLEVWECLSCGASVTQTANLAKLVQEARGSVHLN